MELLFLEMMSIMLSAVIAFGVVVVALHVVRFWRAYQAQLHAVRVERTLHALQLPVNVSDALRTALLRHYREESVVESELWSGNMLAALSFFENLATGIREGLYDERISYNRLGDALPRFYFVVAGALYRSRGEGVSPSLYVELERLARSWRDRSPVSSLKVRV